MPRPLRLAMWSGPRNISTAMMRAWENRGDTAVIDEPFYAHYLHFTGRDHHARDEVIAAGLTNPDDVISQLLGPVPAGQPIFYQKHMTHHLLPHIDRAWIQNLSHCFLIREPRQVIISLLKHVPDATLSDTGFPQQAEIFDLIRAATGQSPPVIDARDVLDHPREILQSLCERLGIDFTERMLSWNPGLRPTDGVWAKYWYKEVETTTSFRPYNPKPEAVPDHLLPMLAECERHYRALFVHRLR